MQYLPLFFDIRDKLCVVVGGGQLALRKIRLLNRAHARVKVVALAVNDEILAVTEIDRGDIHCKPFEESDIDGAHLVIAATDDLECNTLVSQCAKSRGIPVNVVDQPELCSFITPAIVDRDPVTLALSSGGSSPVLLRKLKEQLETDIPSRLGELASFLGQQRDRVKKQIPEFEQRLRFWEALLESEIPELMYSSNRSKAQTLFDGYLQSTDQKPMRGEVYLVGAGPGDPDLLTLRALRLMHKADVVLYDRLVSKEILGRVRPDAELIHVGKQRANHSVPQETINQMLVRLAQAGNRVLRLKGGDPFIFGRGGEEIETLAHHNISFQVVPGITAASGCAAYSGIPLTHRDYSQSVRFLTGHIQKGGRQLDWPSLVSEQQTLVFYMGLAGMATICEELVKHGMTRDTAAALIQQGTTSNQKVVVGDVSTIATRVAKENIQAPTLLIIGEVVKLRNKLAWFEH